MVSEVCFQKEENSWGFRLTGGPLFGMPLTVFEVEEGGRAYKAGLRLGDVLVRINGMDASQLGLEDAHNMISDAENNINLSISNLEDQELKESEELAKAQLSTIEDDTDTESHEILKSDISIADSEVQQSEVEEHSDAQVTEESIVDTSEAVSKDISEGEEAEGSNMPWRIEKPSDTPWRPQEASVVPAVSELENYKDVNSRPLLPPRAAPEPEKAQRKCWHPVMWPDSTPPPAAVVEETTEAADLEYPHKKKLRFIRQAIEEKKVKATPETLIFFLCNKFAVSEESKEKISV